MMSTRTGERYLLDKIPNNGLRLNGVFSTKKSSGKRSSVSPMHLNLKYTQLIIKKTKLNKQMIRKIINRIKMMQKRNSKKRFNRILKKRKNGSH